MTKVLVCELRTRSDFVHSVAELYMYHHLKRLSTFGTGLREGARLNPDGGRVFRPLTDAGTVRTNQVRLKESEFPGLTRIE